jgi:hypothetical protein
MYEKIGKSPIYQPMVFPSMAPRRHLGRRAFSPLASRSAIAPGSMKLKKIIRMLKWILNHCDDTSKLLDNLVMFK